MKVVSFCSSIVNNKFFEFFIIFIILICSIVLGLETIPSIDTYYIQMMAVLNQIILAIFVLEVIIKITANYPKVVQYFYDGWNVFDFIIIACSLIPLETTQFFIVARILRLLRILRLISVIPQLRLIVDTIVKSIPSLVYILFFLIIFFYIYGIYGFYLFHEHDPYHWKNLGTSLLTLFRILTFEDWTDLMYKAMELNDLVWIYFISFIIISSFVIINLFVAIIINNLDYSKKQQEREIKLMDLLDSQRETGHARVSCLIHSTINNSLNAIITDISKAGCQVVFKDTPDIRKKIKEIDDVTLNFKIIELDNALIDDITAKKKYLRYYTGIISIGIKFTPLSETTENILRQYIYNKLFQT